MPNVKFTGLPAQAAIAATDIIPFIKDPGTVPVGSKITFADLKTSLALVTPITTTGKFVFSIGDGSSAIITGIKKCIEVTQNCTITGWKILSDDPSTLAGAVVFDIWKLAYGSGYPPLVGNSLITGGTKPTIVASATSAVSVSMANWTTALAAGDILRFNVDSVATFTSLTLILEVTLT